MAKTNVALQHELDVIKWHESEARGEDMCTKLAHCEHCKREAEFPCAKAYRRMQKASKPVAKSKKK